MTHWFTSSCESVGTLRGILFWVAVDLIRRVGVIVLMGLLGVLVGVGPILGFPFREACLLGAGRAWD